MSEMMRIDLAVAVLGIKGYADIVTDSDRAKARTILKYFRVHQENVYDDGAQRARFYTVYESQAVRNIAELCRNGVMP